MVKPNFSGMATKYGVECSDGRTILADAFEHEDKKRLPLLWRHDDKSPENVLGHVILEHISGEGVRSEAYFNETPRGQHSRQMVEHGDVDSLSIKAIRLRQQGTNVTYGDLTEVSLVPHGANKEARIESVYMQHEDGMIHELENEAIIYSGVGLTLSHEDDSEGSEEDSEDESEEKSPKDRTLGEIYESLDDEQKAAVAVLINAASTAQHEESSEDDDSDDSETINHEGEPHMTRNVFDQTNNNGSKEQGSVLTHEQITSIFDEAKTKQVSSFKQLLMNSDTIQHADTGLEGPYGITNIEALFPEPKQVTDRPEWIKRDDSWVAAVLTGVKSVPFSRIKSASADVTHEEARAKGYIKGTRKKNEYFAVSSRTTDPKTIYKRQGFDRDDLIDLSSFDVVAWVKEEMRWMLQEEVARAILFGDNRPDEDPANPGQPNPDKIDETKIRPIATDDEFYTAKVYVGTGEAPKSLAKRILRSRKLLKGGTSKPTLYTNDDLIVDMLLMEDQLGRRYYETEAALAAALGVKNIVDCDVLEEGYFDDEGNRLLGVLVYLGDYHFGANKGGQESMFEDFDIDFNQHKYLIETRRSGALTKHRSAVSIWETAGTEVYPIAPTSDGTDVLIPTVTGVTYLGYTGTNDPVEVTGTVALTPGETYYVIAEPDEGYRFPFNVDSDWSFVGED